MGFVLAMLDNKGITMVIPSCTLTWLTILLSLLSLVAAILSLLMPMGRSHIIIIVG